MGQGSGQGSVPGAFQHRGEGGGRGREGPRLGPSANSAVAEPTPGFLEGREGLFVGGHSVNLRHGPRRRSRRCLLGPEPA